MDKTLVYILLIVLCDGYAAELSCGWNEVLKCVNECPPEKTCKTRNIEIDCLPSDRPCKTKCVCKDNYVRNAIGDCVPATDCDKCKGDHEFYSSCGGACDNKCSSLDTQSRSNCNIQTFACVSSCYCEDGYARDQDNNCIPIHKCNDRCTGPHEYYVKNKKICPPDQCASIVSRYDCSKVKPSSVCICQDNFLRPKKGAPCIPTTECPEWPKY